MKPKPFLSWNNIQIILFEFINYGLMLFMGVSDSFYIHNHALFILMTYVFVICLRFN